MDGKKNLSVGGEALTKISKKEFLTSSDEHWTLKGNYLSGVVLNTGSEEIRLTPVLKWYEIVLSVLPFILIMVWGNSTALFQIVPVVGGAIGGLISALCCVVNLFIIKPIRQIWLKIIISIVFVGVAFLLCWLIAVAILSAAA
ncbi:MAG TPA: hypothetical protein H9729_01620 [Candidatus Borkfalkia excrementigallinarum]|uniref:Uncharacterized protein n=1 Tax=Candidatus Borkfalkia excrementigallinarum TaxID=2838506 RepID=A0A9D1ZTV7_9FIRM|nr:hypothetical protein [Candidatus Borkfalkia excrementigallinarum]